ncbi:MAG: HU family DNA-binding protein, partial [Gaiellaceae bacterium]
WIARKAEPMRSLARACVSGRFFARARSSKPSNARILRQSEAQVRPIRLKKTRKTAWLSQSDATVRVFFRGPNCRQEEWDLTKQEFVNEIARRADLSSRDAAKAVDAFLDAITETLQGGGEVAFTGFGKFVTQRRAERQGVNPRNPTQKVTIPAATVPKFSAGSQLKAAVKAGGAGA